MSHSARFSLWMSIGSLAGLIAIMGGCVSSSADAPQVLRLSVTTSMRDSGLLDVLIEEFNEQHAVRVDVIAGGTGQSLRLGEVGDVDLLLVHARTAEDAFMAAGHGVRREDIMYNTFEIIGPPEDPAVVRGRGAVEAFRAILAAEARFVSRGDDSGTHKKELALWDAVGEQPAWYDFVESGQGMGPTLIMADERSAYVLSDRGTYLKFRDKISLVSLVQSPEELRNPYGALLVNPAKHSAIQADLAGAFVDFLISREAQLLIQGYQVDGEPLFYPLRLDSLVN